MSDTSRKWAGRGIQALLIVAVLAYVGNWARNHLMPRHENLHLSGLATPPDSLGPGDLRVYSADSTLDVLLLGNKISAGLSPKMVAKIRRDLDSSRTTDSGLGGSIASMVKSTVAGAIGTHAEFPLADLKDIRFDNGHFVFDWKSGSNHVLFQDTKVNGKSSSDVFRPEDAQRFIDAVHARQKELGLTP